jgi:hypothetical protein
MATKTSGDAGFFEPAFEVCGIKNEMSYISRRLNPE